MPDLTIHGTYISFVPGLPKPKTKTWQVATRPDLAPLGMVKWWGPWRKYAFFPFANTLFESLCLREIALFCEGQTKEHRDQVAGRMPR